MKHTFLGAVALFSCALFVCSCASNQKTKTSISGKEAVNNICLYDFVDLEVAKDGLDADELFALGKKYEQGNGVVQCYSLAQIYYEKAKNAGSAEAEKALSRLEEFKSKMIAESPNGQGSVFAFYRTGVTAGQAGEYEKAFAIFYDDVFFFGDTKGIGEIAGLYLKGKGVEQDVEKALSLYEYVATVLKSGNGYSALAKVYEAKDGTYPNITHSMDKALEYFRLSFEGEDLESKDFKGPRYLADYFDSGYEKDDGTFVAPDYVKAEKYYLLASDGNARTFDGTSCYKLGTYYEEGRAGVTQDFSKAAAYYLKAVSDPNTHATMLGIPQSYYSLARFYENGLGVEKDSAKAKSYYEKALSACEETLSYEFAAGREAAEVTQKEAKAALERF